MELATAKPCTNNSLGKFRKVHLFTFVSPLCSRIVVGSLYCEQVPAGAHLESVSFRACAIAWPELQTVRGSESDDSVIVTVRCNRRVLGKSAAPHEPH
eukprot:189620-Amphidinium_carterae.1